MKIGFSFGQCVADIVNGKVKYEDVLFIISGTAIESRDKLVDMGASYHTRAGYWLGLDLVKCMEVTNRLWDGQKVLQPRLQGIYRGMMSKDCIWADLMPSPVKTNAALEEAWQAYRMLVELTGDIPKDVQQEWQHGTY